MELHDLSLDLKSCFAPTNHIWVNSGWTTVTPWLPTVCGVGEFFSPPLSLRSGRLRLSLEVDNRLIPDNGDHGKGDRGLLYAGGTWRPDYIERLGAYHHLIDERLVSLQVISRLVPLRERAGYVLTVSVCNRTDRCLNVAVRTELDPGSPAHLPLELWDFGISAPGQPATRSGRNRWSNDSVALQLIHGDLSAVLDPGSRAEFQVSVVATAQDQGVTPPHRLSDWADLTCVAWQDRITSVSNRLPEISSDIPGLAAYYKRSLLSGLVCLWDNPKFATRPFVATSGMDGGGICTYPWDTGGYSPRVLALLLAEGVHQFVEVMTGFGLEAHSRFSPAGTGLGDAYSYNGWSMINLAWWVSCLSGPTEKLFALARDCFFSLEGVWPHQGHLVDFGEQRNLLEMRGSGWEHVVASPNAERAWCLERLADMADRLGQAGAGEWRQKASEVRAAVRSELWDADAGWFRSVYPCGHQELVYSIQAFDALRAGVCTEPMRAALLDHVREGRFLAPFGVSSISAEDERHYELNDPDWSGGGAYVGDGPMLALTLWEQGEAAMAWDVLKRFFWMGRHLPYYPQEHYCDRPAAPLHKRANSVGGLSGAEAVLFGLVGLAPRLDGSLRVNPQLPVEGNITLTGYAHRGHEVDVEISSRHCAVTVDGRQVYLGAPENVEVVVPKP